MNKHVAIYLRISTAKAKDGHIQDTAMQLLEITAHLKAKGITDFVVYEDKGYSGTQSNRPALKKLMNDCQQGKVSMVVCYKLDRLFRSLKDLMNTVVEWEKLKVDFISVKDSLDMSTAAGRLLFQILGSFAEFEAAVIKERVLSGLANARSKGVKLGRPFKTGHNVIRQLRNEGKTVSEIANHVGLTRQTVYRSLKEGEQNG